MSRPSNHGAEQTAHPRAHHGAQRVDLLDDLGALILNPDPSQPPNRGPRYATLHWPSRTKKRAPNLWTRAANSQ